LQLRLDRVDLPEEQLLVSVGDATL